MAIPSDLQERLISAGQGHLVDHAATLDAGRVKALIQDLLAVDLEELARLVTSVTAEHGSARADIQPLEATIRGADPEQDREAARLGEKLLREGRVAAFLVAGGQGTRLGHAGPKGTFHTTPIAKKTLFQVFAEKLLARGRAAGHPVPLFVMTSPANHGTTVEHFESHDHYGLDPENVRFLSQGTMPAVDGRGRLVLAEPHRLFRSPDGHGGSLRALHRSGTLAEMKRRGIEHIFYFQVDNPLVVMCDPIFIGYHAQQGSEFSSKAVPKRDPGEKVGVLVRQDGVAGVIEYSDLPEELRESRDEQGRLRYRAGNIAVHAIKRSFVERLTADGFSLPFHRAVKKIATVDQTGQCVEVEGVKFETFVFDALQHAERVFLLEVERGQEFSPIKNAEGADSPATAVRDQVMQHVAWLESAGHAVSRDADGEPRVQVEISPLFADAPAGVRARSSEIPGTITDDLLIED